MTPITCDFHFPRPRTIASTRNPQPLKNRVYVEFTSFRGHPVWSCGEFETPNGYTWVYEEECEDVYIYRVLPSAVEEYIVREVNRAMRDPEDSQFASPPFPTSGKRQVRVNKGDPSLAELQFLPLRSGEKVWQCRLDVMGTRSWYWADLRWQHHVVYVEVPTDLLMEAQLEDMGEDVSPDAAKRARELGEAFLRATRMASESFSLSAQLASSSGDMTHVINVSQAHTECCAAISKLYGKALGF